MAPLRSFSALLLYSTCLLTNSVYAAPAASAAPSVTIASGVVIGTRTGVSNQPTQTAQANAYLGIPFAKSPPERFSPPVAAQAWSTPLQATALKPACIQQFPAIIPGSSIQARLKEYFNNPTAAPPPESEDCLYLNVYTPSNATPTSKKPVLFWVFGGNLQFGSGGLYYYNGSSLAINQDVVVVTINYRTNIFGFSNSPEIATGSQNSGFLDQRFALDWVQKNIAQFGGDPNKVMIFGESAGGESVKQLLANPPIPLPFSSAILQSEQQGLFGDGKASYKQVLDYFMCKDIKCLRTIPATSIKTYIEQQSLFFPPVNGDGTAVSDVRPNILSGKFAKVPIIMGTNLNEARVFLTAFGIADGTTSVDQTLDFLNVTDPAVRTSIIANYTARLITGGYETADRIGTDAVFTCSTSTLASFLASNGYNVWRYRYNGVFPNLAIFANPGAYHTVEIPSVFGTYPLANKFGTATPQQIQLSAYMQKVWAGFARNPTTGPGWPAIGKAFGNELGELGANGGSGLTVVNTLVADYPCPLYYGLEDLLGFSY